MSPVRTRLWDGEKLLGGEALEPDAFVLGVTQPTAANTGSRIADVSLSNYAGDITNVSPGETISGLLVTGRIAPNLGAGQTATMRDSVLLGLTDPTPTGSDYFNVGADTGHAGTMRYEHVEVRAPGDSYRYNGWKGGNVELYRCRASGVVDFLSPHGSGSLYKTFVAHGCYADNFYFGTDPNQANTDGLTHPDWCQAQGGLSLLEIIGCANSPDGRPRTSCILLQAGGTLIGQGQYGTVRINQNWFYGSDVSGSTVNVPITATKFGEFELIGNRVSQTGKTPRVLIHSTVRSAFAATISGNVILETSAALTINNAD